MKVDTRFSGLHTVDISRVHPLVKKEIKEKIAKTTHTLKDMDDQGDVFACQNGVGYVKGDLQIQQVVDEYSKQGHKIGYLYDSTEGSSFNWSSHQEQAYARKLIKDRFAKAAAYDPDKLNIQMSNDINPFDF